MPASSNAKQIADAVQALVVGLNAEGRVTFFNRYACEVSGCEAEDALGRMFWEFLPDEYAKPVRDRFMMVRANQSCDEFECLLITRDGTQQQVTWRLHTGAEREGGIEVVAVGFDAPAKPAGRKRRWEGSSGPRAPESEREQLLAQLQKEQARLRAVIANSPVAIVVADHEGRILLSNPEAKCLHTRPIAVPEDGQESSLRHCHPDGTPYDPADLPLARSAVRGETVVNEDCRWPAQQCGARP